MPNLLVELLNFSFFNFKNVIPYTVQKYTKVVATYITHIATHITHVDHISTYRYNFRSQDLSGKWLYQMTHRLKVVGSTPSRGFQRFSRAG
jgi:hypothetical protein